MPLGSAVNIEDLRRLAKRRLPRAIFDFFDGGAEDEVTLRENRAAFERVRLLPRVLVNVAQVDTKVEIFGKPMNLPLAIAPTGGISAGRYGAELDAGARRQGLRRALHHGDALGVRHRARRRGSRRTPVVPALRRTQPGVQE